MTFLDYSRDTLPHLSDPVRSFDPEEVLAAVRKNRDYLMGLLGEKEAEITLLRETGAEFEGLYRKARNAFLGRETEIGSLKQRLDVSRGSSSEKDARIADLERMVDGASEIIAETEKVVGERDEKIAVYEKAIHELNVRAASYSRELIRLRADLARAVLALDAATKGWK